jgi:hypothetical protein
LTNGMLSIYWIGFSESARNSRAAVRQESLIVL